MGFPELPPELANSPIGEMLRKAMHAAEIQSRLDKLEATNPQLAAAHKLMGHVVEAAHHGAVGLIETKMRDSDETVYVVGLLFPSLEDNERPACVPLFVLRQDFLNTVNLVETPEDCEDGFANINNGAFGPDVMVTQAFLPHPDPEPEEYCPPGYL